MNEAQDAALKYHRDGLPITLCHAGKKKPYAKGWPEKRYTISEIKNEFRTHQDLNVGTVLGPRSKIIDVEYDGIGGERAVLEMFDGDVPVTPSWLSKRGVHRAFQWHPDLDRIGKSVIKLGPLEIRLGANCKGMQSLLPPSTSDGFKRTWSVPIWECDPAPLNNFALKLLLNAGKDTVSEVVGEEKTRDYREDRETEAIASVSLSTLSLCNSSPNSTPHPDSAISVAIRRTLPSTRGHRHRSLFTFARHVKAIPSLADANLDSLLPFVEQWHEAALPYIGTKDFDESWADFVNAWVNVKFPAGQEPIRMIYQQAISQCHLPRAAEKYKNLSLRRLVLLCRELQRVSGDQPFYLACRTAAELLGINHTLANKFLRLLVYEHILDVTKAGTQRHATRYRYLGD